MSPEKANICIIDDNEVVIEGLTTIIETRDHRVLLTAEGKEDALEAIKQFEEYGIDVVFLDTKLVSEDFEGKESKEVLKNIRSVAPNVKVITMSTEIPLEGGDVRMQKNFTAKKLLEIIDSL